MQLSRSGSSAIVALDFLISQQLSCSSFLRDGRIIGGWREGGSVLVGRLEDHMWQFIAAATIQRVREQGSKEGRKEGDN